MDFSYDDEQDALREAVRGIVGKAYSDFEKRRQAVADDPGFDEAQWQRMAEMGLLGLPFAEDDGGVGAGPVEIGIVCQELGRVIAPEPFLTSVVLAGGLVSAVGTAEQRQEHLGALSGGESVLAFAHAEPGRPYVDDAEHYLKMLGGHARVELIEVREQQVEVAPVRRQRVRRQATLHALLREEGGGVRVALGA